MFNFDEINVSLNDRIFEIKMIHYSLDIKKAPRNFGAFGDNDKEKLFFAFNIFF